MPAHFLLPDPDSSHTHTSTNTHTGNTDLLIRAFQLRQQCADLARTRAAKRVSERNRTTLGVDLLLGKPKLVDTPDTLGGKGLVDLEDVDVVLGDAGLLEGNGDGLPWANTHEQGLDTHNAGGDELANDLLAEALGGGALHEEHGSGAVRDLRGVTGMDGTVLGEGRADLAEGLSSDALADAIVGLDGDGLLLLGLGVGPLDIQREDLLVEQAGLLGLDGLLV